jgi:apolipoprotein N-acyltransferase
MIKDHTIRAMSPDPLPLAQPDRLATYRAIENGFSIVRPAGHEISTIIDYQGRILARQDDYTNSSIMLTTVPTRGVPTVYGRVGDLFAYLCVAGLVSLTGWALSCRKRAIPAETTGGSRL